MADNPHYATMKEYLEILEEVLFDSNKDFFSDVAHPEDLGAAVETANKHIESVMSYWARKWWDTKGKNNLYGEVNINTSTAVSTPPLTNY